MILPYIVALFSGLLFSLSFPNDLLPGRLGDHPTAIFAWVALPPFFWVIFTLPQRAARTAAFLFGLGMAVNVFSWMRLFGPIPWLLITIYEALTPWAAVWLMQRMRLLVWLTTPALAICWAGLEWLRGQGTIGFPWGELGSSQIDGITSLPASLGGITLVTFLLLLTAGVAVDLILHRESRRARSCLLLAIAPLLVASGWWQTHLATARWQAGKTGMTYALVQPNSMRGISPDVLVNGLPPGEFERRMRNLTALSRHALDSAPTGDRCVVWSESALPSPPYDPEVYKLCIDTGSTLLAGAPFVDDKGVANSVFLFGPRGEELNRYAKVHLVPFGEFIPWNLRPLLEPHFTIRPRDIVPGSGWPNLSVNGHNIGVGICFETTFPAVSRIYARQGAHALVFVTNDAWFHRTSALRQHFNHARFRARETGLPVIRVSDTGISGICAPDGSIIDEIPPYAVESRARYVPDGTPGTIFTAGGWLFGPFCLIFSIILAIIGVLRHRFSSK